MTVAAQFQLIPTQPGLRFPRRAADPSFGDIIAPNEQVCGPALLLSSKDGNTPGGAESETLCYGAGSNNRGAQSL
jgi:hypothetical protein